MYKADIDNIVNGKNDATNFSAQLMRIVFKADIVNRAKLHTLYPNLVRTVAHFKYTGEILDLPDDKGVPIEENYPLYTMAWHELYNAFGERMQHEELKLMDSVLAGVTLDEKERHAKQTLTESQED